MVLILVVVEDGLVLPVKQPMYKIQLSLNPCCSGRWSRTVLFEKTKMTKLNVLILVVVEDGLVHDELHTYARSTACLNPCCSGRWSRTRPYKTLLIINKLKNFTKQIFTFLNRKLTIS